MNRSGGSLQELQTLKEGEARFAQRPNYTVRHS